MGLKKTTVNLRASEDAIFKLIEKFNSLCLLQDCETCNVFKGKRKLECENKCLARYVYENTVNYK